MIWLWLGAALVTYQAYAESGRATKISNLPLPDALPILGYLVGLLWHICIEPKEGGQT